MGIVTKSTDKYQACIDACNRCAQACFECFKACLISVSTKVVSGCPLRTNALIPPLGSPIRFDNNEINFIIKIPSLQSIYSYTK